MEQIKFLSELKVIKDIFDGTEKCKCGKTLSFNNLDYGYVGESFQCSCGEHYLIGNDEEIVLLVKYRYEYNQYFYIIKETYCAKVDLDKGCIIRDSVKMKVERLFFDLKEINGKKTLDFYYQDEMTNKVTSSSESFFKTFKFGDLHNLIEEFSKLCRLNKIKPNYGEILGELCTVVNTINYDELFRIVFTEYLVELLIKSDMKYLIDVNILSSLKLIKASLTIKNDASSMSEMLNIPNKVIKMIAKNRYGLSKISNIQDFFVDRSYNEFVIFMEDERFSYYDLIRIRSLLNNGYSAEKLYKYIQQLNKEERLDCSEVLILLDDTYRMSQAMQVDFRPYSKNLRERHDRLQGQYEIIERELHENRLKEATEGFEIKQVSNKYIAKVLKTVDEFKAEKEGQKNCVLSYLPNVKKDELVIIAIRKKENIDKTFITVELKRNTIVQAKGYANSKIDNEAFEYLKELAFKNGWGIKRV